MNQLSNYERKLLVVVQDAKEISGAGIYEAMLGRRWACSSGSMYPALKRLEDNGRLISRWGDATAARGWRRPRLYKVTSPYTGVVPRTTLWDDFCMWIYSTITGEPA